MPSSVVEAVYRLRASAADARARAEAIAHEQTVELPPALVSDAIRERVVGRVVDVRPADDGVHDAVLHFDASLACGQLSQLLNLVAGNVALLPGVRLVDLSLPDELLAALPGPRFGIEGLRRRLGVGGRPLLMTAIKPRGLSIEEMAVRAADFVAGGGDVVKDDQNLNDARFEDWYERVARCADAVASADGHGLYAPHLAGPPDEMERRAVAVRSLGLEAVLMSPMIVGPDATAALARRHGLAVLGHPAGSGPWYVGDDHGVDAAIVLGILFRLSGADVTIFPNAGGRFAFTPRTCRAIAEAARAPLGAHAPIFPAPAGGMDFDRVDDMAAAYGPDTVFLVGGALLAQEDGLREATTRFVEALRAHFDETPVDADTVSACEIPDDVVSTVRAAMPHLGDFEWEGRPSTSYKDDGALAFRGVRRVELVGRHGERTGFHLRYFEVAPGGYTSLEKHVHTHTLIGARGHGVLVRGEERSALGEHDVAYVGPLEVHQLRNESDAPFGFYCIVDADRDRPQAP